MDTYSTLLYKQRDKIQIQILRKIATDGKHSKKSLEIILEKHHPVIDNAVKQLLKKNLISKAYGDYNNKRGQPEKFYRLTKDGINILIDEIQMPLDEFWKMLFRISDFDGDYITSGYVDSNGKFIDEDISVFKNLTIQKLIQKYENTVLGFNRKHIVPNISSKISNFQLMTNSKLTSHEKLIIEIFALYGSLTVSELSIKLSKQITKIPKKLFDLYFLVKSTNNEKYTITVLGIQYLIFVIFKQFKHNIQIQKINILLENQKNILPLIFRKWKWLTRYFSNKELFNILIDAIDPNQRQLPFQTNSGVQEILDSHKNLEDVSKNKISNEYEVGFPVYYRIKDEKIINLKPFRKISKIEKIENFSKVISKTLDTNSSERIRKIDKSLHLGKAELDKLQLLSRFDSIDKGYPDEIKKQHKMTYEQNKTDSLSFRFYSILLSQIHQKNIKQNEWFDFLKTDKDIMPWYGNWINEINNFESKNADYRNNLTQILLSKD